MTAPPRTRGQIALFFQELQVFARGDLGDAQPFAQLGDGDRILLAQSFDDQIARRSSLEMLSQLPLPVGPGDRCIVNCLRHGFHPLCSGHGRFCSGTEVQLFLSVHLRLMDSRDREPCVGSRTELVAAEL